MEIRTNQNQIGFRGLGIVHIKGNSEVAAEIAKICEGMKPKADEFKVPILQGLVFDNGNPSKLIISTGGNEDLYQKTLRELDGGYNLGPSMTLGGEPRPNAIKAHEISERKLNELDNPLFAKIKDFCTKIGLEFDSSSKMNTGAIENDKNTITVRDMANDNWGIFRFTEGKDGSLKDGQYIDLEA